MTAPTLRPYLPADAPRLARLFETSISLLAADDYDEEQRAAWAAAADDVPAFAAKLAGALTLIAEIDGAIAGFASLKDNTHIDMIFTHPAFARRGVAGLLLDALEKLARARGAEKLTGDVSDTAQPLFEKSGFIATQRNSFQRRGVWLANTTMEKRLAAPAGATKH